MEALDVHLSDQEEAADADQARHLAHFYKYLRREGIPRWLAAVMTVVHQAGDQWPAADWSYGPDQDVD